MREPVTGRRWRVVLALAGSLSVATASGHLLARNLPLADPLERLYAALFGSLALGLSLLCGGLLASKPRSYAGGLGVLLLVLGLAAVMQ